MDNSLRGKWLVLFGVPIASCAAFALELWWPTRRAPWYWLVYTTREDRNVSFNDQSWHEGSGEEELEQENEITIDTAAGRERGGNNKSRSTPRLGRNNESAVELSQIQMQDISSHDLSEIRSQRSIEASQDDRSDINSIHNGPSDTSKLAHVLKL